MLLTTQVIFAGIANGCLFALCGLSVSFVYRVTGLLNFAQGALVMFAGLLFAKLTRDGWTVTSAGAAAVAVVTAAAAVEGLALQRWFGKEREVTGALLTMGLTLAAASIAAIVFGREALAAPKLVQIPDLRLNGAVIRGDQLLMIAAVSLVGSGFWFWSRKTDQGKMFAALVDDPDGAQLVGLRPVTLRVAAFAIGGLLAGVAGIAIVPATTMSFTSGDQLLATGLTASAVGGLGSPLAAVVGGLVVGLLGSTVAGTTGSLFSIVVPTAVLALVIAVRREGLLSGPEGRTV
jgi:branched-chain amino acid transport system permease protein